MVVLDRAFGEQRRKLLERNHSLILILGIEPKSLCI